ncbi:MAG TPA: FG-GAP-like repeat-containing protein, partial [Candidatus Saccharimonadales bacterium]|nr:FG-GAP-like repeat-containing protein [Candidatus Saccharimonadales bacterium]
DIVISRQNSSGTTSPKAYLTVYHNATSEPLSILPIVQINSPTDGAIYTTGEDVAITANASDSDGSISRVSFFSGTNLLGTVTNAPYTILWPNVQLGSYVLRAKAFDNLGDFTTSDPIVVRVVPGAAPVVESFSPLSGPIGTAVSIIGSNFNSIAANNVVYFGGVRGVVTAASSTNLIVTVPAGATYQPITVTSRGLSCAAKVPFIVTFIGAQQVRFETGVDYSTENASVLRETLLTADLDGDGRLDLSCITQPGNFAGGLALFRNRSTPGALDQTSFERLGQIPPLFPQMNLTPNTAIIADVDGDGNLDFVMAEAGVVGIYRNLGTGANLNNGSFAGPVGITVPNLLAAPHGIAVGDLDGDGHPDIVVCKYGGVSLLRNRASPGTIESNSFELPLTVFTNSTPSVVVIADMDQDGKPDLVLLANTVVTVLRNVSTGPGSTNLAFGNPVLLNFPQGQQPINLTIGDMDGDGRPDIIAHGAGASSCSTAIFRNLTSGPGLTSASFAPGVQIAGPFTGDQGMAAVADMNGDGKLDLVVLTPRFGSDSTVSVFINQGSPGAFNTGSLAFPVEIMVPSNYPSTWVALADVDGDVRADIVVARRSSSGLFSPQGYLTVYRNSTPPPANLPPTVSITSPAGGSTYFAPATIPITATAADSDGSIAYVSFFSGATLLGTISNAPYTLTWTNVPVGTFTLTAKASDNLGAVTTSAGITVTVNPVPIPPTISGQPQSRSVEIGSNVSFSVTAAGTAPRSYQWLFNGNVLSGATTSNLVLSSVQFSNAGQYSVIITNIAGSITSNPAILTVTPIGGRLVHVADASAAPGTSVAIPILLVGQGNENAVTFNIAFPPSILAYGSAQLGSGASEAVLNVNDSEAAVGRLGISLALSADHTLPAGTQELVVVTFNVAAGIANTTVAISFGNQPLSPEISDTLANVLTASYLGGSVAVVGGGYEGDVAPLPDGNGTVSVTDWIKIGRYAARLDPIPSPSQFQRADCAPRSTLGNGAITTTDWVQAGRYAAGLDPLTLAGGPTSSGSGFATPKGVQAKLVASPSTTRNVQFPGTGLRAGQTNIVPVQLVAQGNESALGFSVNFNPALLAFVSASTGANAAGAVLNVNASQATAGQIGMVMTLPIGTGTNTFPAGTQEVALLRFVVASNAIGVTPVLFGDHPATTEVSDSLANSLAANFVSGALQVEPPLKISRAGSSNNLSWPTWASNAVLETTAALPALPSWHSPSATSTNIAAGEIRVSVPLTPTQGFFRLRFP